MKRPFHTFALLGLFLLSLAAGGCKEEEESTLKLTMEGSLSLPFPAYLQKNTHVTVSISGITDPQEVTYKWLCTSVYTDTIVSNVISFRVPDSLGTFSLMALAQAEGYYQVSATATFNTVDTVGGAAMTGLAPASTSFTDPRDGVTYPTVKLGALEWFARNLQWDGTGDVYRNSPITDGLFGRFYTWEEATGNLSGSGLAGGPQGACPPGWTVPTREDFEDLAQAVLGSPASFTDTWPTLGEQLSAQAFFNGERMWPYSPYNEHTNTVGWNAIPVGGAMMDHANFTGFSDYAYFWCATEKDAARAYYRYIYSDLGTFPMASTSKTDFAASVRCVRAL